MYADTYMWTYHRARRILGNMMVVTATSLSQGGLFSRALRNCWQKSSRPRRGLFRTRDIREPSKVTRFLCTRLVNAKNTVMRMSVRHCDRRRAHRATSAYCRELLLQHSRRWFPVRYFSCPPSSYRHRIKDYHFFYEQTGNSKRVAHLHDLPTRFILFGSARTERICHATLATLQMKSRKYNKIIRARDNLLEYLPTATHLPTYTITKKPSE